MQIRAITVNAAGMAPERNMPGNIQPGPAQPGDNVFGPECRVTISREGRTLSSHQSKQPDKESRSAESLRAERQLLRLREDEEQAKKSRDDYRAELSEIEKQIADRNSSYEKKSGIKETVEKKQALLEAMRTQKEKQLEENQRRAQEAREMAAQTSRYQDEIDENNRDLVTLLRTLRESEEAEKDEKEKGKPDHDTAQDQGESVSDVIKNSATQFVTSSVKREWGVQEQLEEFTAEGHWYLEQANSIARNLFQQTADIRAALDEESYSDEEIEEMMQNFRAGLRQNYMDIEDYRGFGLQILQDAGEEKLQHIADNPLAGMQQTKDSMMLSAVDAALGEARQGVLDKASQELADEVEELIDERNKVDELPSDEEKEEKKVEEEKEEEKVEEEKKETERKA